MDADVRPDEGRADVQRLDGGGVGEGDFEDRVGGQSLGVRAGGGTGQADQPKRPRTEKTPFKFPLECRRG